MLKLKAVFLDTPLAAFLLAGKELVNKPNRNEGVCGGEQYT